MRQARRGTHAHHVLGLCELRRACSPAVSVACQVASERLEQLSLQHEVTAFGIRAEAADMGEDRLRQLLQEQSESRLELLRPAAMARTQRLRHEAKGTAGVCAGAGLR